MTWTRIRAHVSGQLLFISDTFAKTCRGISLINTNQLSDRGYAFICDFHFVENDFISLFRFEIVAISRAYQ